MILKLNDKNPRTISKIKYEKLLTSIESFAKMLELRPIIYDEDGVIWGGNMRYQALMQLHNDGKVELKDEYFKQIIGYTEEEKKEFAIRDNVELGDWDMDLLANEWSDLPLSDWGVLPSAWGTEPQDVNELWKENGMPDYGDPSAKKPFRSVMVHFETQQAVDDFAELIGQTITGKTKFVWVPRKNEV